MPNSEGSPLSVDALRTTECGIPTHCLLFLQILMNVPLITATRVSTSLGPLIANAMMDIIILKHPSLAMVRKHQHQFMCLTYLDWNNRITEMLLNLFFLAPGVFLALEAMNNKQELLAGDH